MKVFAKDGEFELDPELVRSLVATYPAVNVRRELERMYLWSLKNPARRWELPLRGIETWLRKATRQALEAKATKRQQAKETEQKYLGGVKTRLAVTEAWWTSNEGVEKRAAQLGMVAKRGESYADFKARVAEADKISRTTRAA